MRLTDSVGRLTNLFGLNIHQKPNGVLLSRPEKITRKKSLAKAFAQGAMTGQGSNQVRDNLCQHHLFLLPFQLPFLS